MFDDAGLIIVTAVMVPLMLTVAYLDLRYLRIPNWAVLGVVALFLGVGVWSLPLDVFLWRIAYGVIVLVVGFLLYNVAGSIVGAGDLKLIAALAPFLSGTTIGPYLLTYSLLSIVGLIVRAVVLRFVGRERNTGWQSIDQRGFFPAGLLLGLSIVIQLCAELSQRFV
ncbi:MAG: prepilin peptidase [Pseudomonadota bacterium]